MESRRAVQRRMLQNGSEAINRSRNSAQGKQDPPLIGLQRSDLGCAIKDQKFSNDSSVKVTEYEICVRQITRSLQVTYFQF